MKQAEHSRASVLLWSACLSLPVPDASLEKLEFSKSKYLIKAGGQLAFLGQELCGKFHAVEDCNEGVADWLLWLLDDWTPVRDSKDMNPVCLDNIKHIRQEDDSHPTPPYSKYRQPSNPRKDRELLLSCG